MTHEIQDSKCPVMQSIFLFWFASIVSVRAIWSSSSSINHHTAFYWYIYLVWHMTFQSSHSWLISNVIYSFILIVSCRTNLSIHHTLSIIRAQSSISMVDAVFWKWVILYNRQWENCWSSTRISSNETKSYMRDSH